VPNPEVLRASALRAADRLPLLSVVLSRALGLLAQGDDVSVRDLSTVIEEDVVITGSLLSIANSAFYRGNSKVASVRPAIVRLGLHKARNVLLGLTVSRCFKSVRVPGPWSSIRFNSHSLAVATLSDLIVQSVPSQHAEWAFMAGLLHDIGLPLIAVGLPEQYRTITMQTGSEADIVHRERELLGFTHFDLGAEMLARWNCPAMVQEATRFGDSVAIPSEQPPHLGTVVKTASLLADSNGISIFDSREDDDLAIQLLDALGITAPLDFIAKFEAEYSNVQASAA
jgi:HD-like signal output (HDOD) protein